MTDADTQAQLRNFAERHGRQLPFKAAARAVYTAK